ncbi:AAA family ATPase [Chitinophaga polysaccharea]|uniref:AAA family ATPase n=1 Tax=Chitinophaga polysaccharea TaxID=1293035 RepID=UPI00145561E7|nr:AAA family ATPase [Chitinophaga polysaccharea]NLR58845.1 AAA family ATPase [Chitinophaga polysaccharea]
MYSVVKYKDIIDLQDEDTIKRYRLIEQLSKGFTVAHKIAQEMDHLLTEQLELTAGKPHNDDETDDEDTGDDHMPVPPVTSRKPQSRTAISTELETAFRDLFAALKDQKPQIIRYELPQVTTPEMEKPEIDSFQQIVDDLVLGSNVFLVGGAGTGKTYLAEVLVAHKALGRQHITINCSQWTSPIEIIGGQSMDGYVEGKLIEAWQRGYVLVLDELPKIDPNTAGLFNDALAKSKTPNAIIFNARKESFTKHPDFACIATGNVYPNRDSMAYGANNKQDLSLLDRFSGSVYLIEKNPKIERRIIQNDMLWSVCDKLRSAVEELKYEAQLSLRFMQNARDAYLLEMQRHKSEGSDGVKANEGKTFRSAIDSYLSTFTDVQQQNLKQRINYPGLFSNYQYRALPTGKLI